MNNAFTIVIPFFRVFNFGLLIILLGYQFKKRLLQPLRQQMTAKKAIPINNTHLCQTLDEQEAALREQIEKEEEQAHALLIKIDQWKAYTDHKNAQRQQEQEKYARELIARTKIATEALAAQEQYKELIPCVIQQAEKLLIEQFQSENQRGAFMLNILNRIKKEHST